MKVAIVQICSVLDYKENLNKITHFIQKAKEETGVKYFFLPEVFYSMSDGTEATPYLIEGDNKHFQNMRDLAKNNEVYLLGGTAATLVNGKIYNRVYNFAPDGSLLNTYDKQNLFSLQNIKNAIDESKVYSAGSDLVTLDLTDEWRLGLSVCFDLRFSSLYRDYYKLGVNIITVSSAFTVPTGKAHWEVLLRARAIEGQCYVIAANQVGVHNDRISTYGHSMIIDPWGRVLANAEDSEGFITADLELSELKKVRSRINMA